MENYTNDSTRLKTLNDKLMDENHRLVAENDSLTEKIERAKTFLKALEEWLTD